VEAVKEWVRTLAMLIILATCLDLLVPMGSMKKYVRVAMGLLLMLNMINPFFTLLRQPVALDPDIFLPGQGTARLPTLAEIMAEAERFREKNEALALEEARSRLQAEVEASARSVEGVAAARAQVELEGRAGRYALRRVVVIITPGAPRGVRPVLPVLQVSPVGTEPAGGDPDKAAIPEGDEAALAEQVRQEVARRLELSDGNVPVEVLIRRESTSQRR